MGHHIEKWQKLFKIGIYPKMNEHPIRHQTTLKRKEIGYLEYFRVDIIYCIYYLNDVNYQYD